MRGECAAAVVFLFIYFVSVNAVNYVFNYFFKVKALHLVINKLKGTWDSKHESASFYSISNVREHILKEKVK